MEAARNVEKNAGAAGNGQSNSGTWRSWLFSSENNSNNSTDSTAQLSESFVRKSGLYLNGVQVQEDTRHHARSRRSKSHSLSKSAESHAVLHPVRSHGSSSFATTSSTRSHGSQRGSDEESSDMSSEASSSSASHLQDREHAEMEAEGLLWEAQVGAYLRRSTGVSPRSA